MRHSQASSGAASEAVTVDTAGNLIPAQLVTLRAADNVAIVPRIERLTSFPWHGRFTTADGTAPLDRLNQPELHSATPRDRTLPDQPVQLLREGRLRGVRIVVVAFYPVFKQSGRLEATSSTDVTIPHTAPLTDDATQFMASASPFLAQAPAPSNPIAGRKAVRIRVTDAGIQQITGAMLAATGLDITSLSPAHLQLWHGGTRVALEEHGTTDGRLDVNDGVRFYASTVGDRWNNADTYWLTVEATPGLRMITRSALPGDAPPQTHAFEQGIWRNNTFYDSRLPGPDGDHWFAANLQTGPGRQAATLDISLRSRLPLAPGTTVLTVTGSAYTSGQHNLSIQMGPSTATARWSGTGNWMRSFTLADNVASIVLRLTPGVDADGVLLDSMSWQRPVVLDFAGNGADFTGVAGQWRYQLTHTATDRVLYDVSDPRLPVTLSIPEGTTTEFEDGPIAKRYVLSGPGTIFTPKLSLHVPADLAKPVDADVVYIAPAAFHKQLGPLLVRREAQGYTVRVIDVQAIYDSWSFGQVSPDSIRHFLQYAAATWHRPPVAAVLVGDGTSDPLNYAQHNHTNLIPPYLAMVDPWLGETACETCYAQLDGDNPLTDPLPDLAVGRLPVKSTAELASLVNKLVAYETGPLDPSWQTRNIYIADDADQSGDFAALADLSAMLQPRGVAVQRMYYDPLARNSGESWREPDAQRARQRTLAAFNAGAGIINYIGHGYYWQWALTDPSLSSPFLLGLYDIDTLTNNHRLPIVLEMSCYTSGFQTPSHSGTTIDERLVLKSSGGAAAVWGPTSLSAVGAHVALQRGFYRALWAAPPKTASLGLLVAGGYLELFTTGKCCQDSLRTYALLGDPLTVPQVSVADHIYLPVVKR